MLFKIIIDKCRHAATVHTYYS